MKEKILSMEEIYMNVEPVKPVHQTSATHNRGSISTRKRLCLGFLISLGVLLLLAGLVVFGIRSREMAAELSTINDNLTEQLQISNDKLSSMTGERDLLNANLTEMNKQFIKLQSLSKQKKTCPAGWVMFRCSCYLLSTKSASWDKARKDCRDRGADLTVVDDKEKQTFISQTFTKGVWIGLTDKETEGSWKWVDGTPIKQSYWGKNQPDNGNGEPQWGEEDCAHTTSKGGVWNDFSCASSNYWICEKSLI